MKKSFLLKRLREHRKGDLARRWDRFSWFGLRWVLKSGKLSAPTGAKHAKTPEVLDIIEAILIHSAEPPLNRQGGRFGSKVVRYVQRRDERLGMSDRQLLQRIHETVDALHTLPD